MAEYNNRSVVRALSIIEVLLDAHHGLLLSDVASLTELDRVTTFRLLRVLSDRGYVVRDERSKRYSVMLNPAYFHNKSELLAIAARLARRPLQKLHDEIGENVNVASYLGVSITYRRMNLTVENPSADLRWSMLPSHATALGKVLLSTRPQSEVRRVFEHIPLYRYTSETIENLSDLEEELGRIKTQGYAVSDCELEADTICVAVPVDLKRKNCTLAISSCRSASKESSLPLDRLVEAMKNAASAIQSNFNNIQ